jgi:uncharacterized protein
MSAEAPIRRPGTDGRPDRSSVPTAEVQLATEADARTLAFDWPRIAHDLESHGNAVLEGLLAPQQCAELMALYDVEGIHRRRIIMASHGYGRGEYKYFDYPLPPLVQALRTALYRHLAPIANRWAEALGEDTRYPADHATYVARCHAAGQTRPTPLLLKYGVDDYNRLHQDLYGEHVFPLQVTVLLSEPGREFTGGEFVLTEQRPRMQSRVEVVPLAQGDAVVFAVNQRPARGPRGTHRVRLRHGVSRLRSGQRLTLGVIFHDAA